MTIAVQEWLDDSPTRRAEPMSGVVRHRGDVPGEVSRRSRLEAELVSSIETVLSPSFRRMELIEAFLHRVAEVLRGPVVRSADGGQVILVVAAQEYAEFLEVSGCWREVVSRCPNLDLEEDEKYGIDEIEIEQSEASAEN